MDAPTTATETFRAARDQLFAHREDYDAACREFRWPNPAEFNWAIDWFDRVLAVEHAAAAALWIVEEDGGELRLTFAELARRSLRVTGWLRGIGVRRGDPVLVMLGNQVELWETLLACIRLGAVIIPASTLLGAADLPDRIARGQVRHVVARSADAPKFPGVPGGPGVAGGPGGWTRVAVGPPVPGWLRYADAYEAPADFTPDGPTAAGDPLLRYFTSGTTAQPKLVEHTHASYPIGHLSTMYWVGLRPGDVHLNISSPGWAKHAWSNVFAPWNAAACVLVHNYERFSAPALLEVLRRCAVSTFCAPPTVWRMLVQEDLAGWSLPLREAVAAGEPLNPEVIEQVSRAWGITVRDGFGQTETTAQVGNTPGQPVTPGSMGRPLPGYAVVLVDPVTGAPGAEGEICLDLARRPAGLMTGYRDDPQRTAEVMRDGFYHTGDVASRDDAGYLTYVGRSDDVFKASDYRISPFELESVLIEHPAVAEAAVVPSPDPLRLAVPKAYVLLASGVAPSRETARDIFRHCRERLAPYKRVRRLEFAELPKTISGKIRRVELRGREGARAIGTDGGPVRHAGEYREEDFPELRS
ncbi:MAG: AMP-binding protein [Actinobacteria bacterium]|nr:AMP-binding protein [Actinomycetota bacterium]MBI3687909.1 AMP-binding protein [Actinomycetota bacterium]